MPCRLIFLCISLIFVYTTITNCIERPEGVHIATFFIITIFLASVVSRALRSVELRIHKIELDPQAEEFIQSASKTGNIRILAHRPDGTEYELKERESREIHSIQEEDGDFIFLEVALGDASDFIEDCLEVEGTVVEGFPVMRCTSPAIPNAIAALLLDIRDKTGVIPRAYFGWTEGNPIGYIFKYIFFGEGETAPVTREILRELEPDPSRRPKIHVG